MNETTRGSARSRRLWMLSLASTAILTLWVVSVGWTSWQPLEVIWREVLGAPDVGLNSIIWLRLANIAPVLLLGPGLLVVARRVTRAHGSAWLLMPVVALLAWGAMAAVIPLGVGEAQVKKPVIYLYPSTPQTVRVSLDLNGRLTKCIPAPDAGSTSAWTVDAMPDGRLVSQQNGREYPYIYWEGVAPIAADMSQGSVVPRSEIGRFLEDVLAEQGLSEEERADFIDYWQPRMAEYPFVLVHFEQEGYERVARLAITPEPDITLRVFMLFEGLERPRDVTAQSFPSVPERRGFVAVEWGGAELPPE